MSENNSNDNNSNSNNSNSDNGNNEASAEVDTEVVAQESGLQERLLSADCWLRFVFMVLFALILCIATYIIATLVVLQFIWCLVKGTTNGQLQQFGSSLSQYIYQVLCFLMYSSDDKPFPFADWPDSEKQP